MADPAGIEQGLLGLHRSIRVVPGQNLCRALLHDDFHHFRLTLRHDGAAVTGISTETRRGPYSLCARAGAELAVLTGLPLVHNPFAVSRAATLRHQCTHQFELAALAVAAAGRAEALRYDLAVRADAPERFSGEAVRDGRTLLAWTVEQDRIVTAGPFAGRGLRIGFSQWAAAELPADLAEAALVLQRAFILARARRHIPRLDSLRSAVPTGNCWVQQVDRADSALRLHGVVRDYSDGTVPFDAADQAWLAEAE